MPVRLHSGQSKVFDDFFVHKKARFGSVCCSRGWGKSYFMATAATTACFELMHLPAKVPNKRVAIIAPTYDQVTEIYYPLLAYEFGLEDYAISCSQDQGRFRFPNNVDLRLLSYEAVERMRGKGYYFVGWDEVSSCKKGIDPKEAWQSIIQPCIVTRWSPERAALYGAPSPGRGIAISTPEGYNFFHEMHHYEEKDDLWKSYHYDYKSSPFLDPEEIERIKHTIDPLKFAREYLASFKESGNSVFYCFDRKLHVRQDIPDFQPGETIYACIDFNVGIMATSLFALRGNQMQFIDEFKGHPDTEILAVNLKLRYPKHKIVAFPDPTGRARKTSAAVGRTDFSILETASIQTLARSKSPALVDSVAAVNRLLKTAAGTTNMFFHPRCDGTILSMERTKWVDKNPDSALIDKTEGIEHFSDGVRYAAEYLFPIQTGNKAAARGFNF
jgi:hypothetical protein